VSSTICSFPIITPCYNITSEWLQWPPPIHINHHPAAAQHHPQSKFYCTTIYMPNTNTLGLRENWNAWYVQIFSKSPPPLLMTRPPLHHLYHPTTCVNNTTTTSMTWQQQGGGWCGWVVAIAATHSWCCSRELWWEMSRLLSSLLQTVSSVFQLPYKEINRHLAVHTAKWRPISIYGQQHSVLTVCNSELNNHNNKTNHTYCVAAQIEEWNVRMIK